MLRQKERGTDLYDRGLGVLEKYGLEAKTVFRGRGSLICETEAGLKIIREYWGSPGKLEQQRKLQLQCREKEFSLVDLVLENQEGQVVTMGEEGIPYMVRDWYQGRECDTRSEEDIGRSVRAMASLHTVLRMEREEGISSINLAQECQKHNQELRRIRKFLVRKKRKNLFEEKLSGSIQCFLEQAETTVGEMEQDSFCRNTEKIRDQVCHGECTQHNILFTREGIAFTNFEHWDWGPQIMDLGQFMRKILEKYQWDLRLAEKMLNAYDSRRSLSKEELQSLRLYLAYPWKFWKLANFYTSSNKVWISQKNIEKLEQTIGMLKPWQRFLESFPRK